MARHGNGLYLRGQTWYLDCRLNGARHGQQLARPHPLRRTRWPYRTAILVHSNTLAHQGL
jgi:hypothetical protein